MRYPFLFFIFSLFSPFVYGQLDIHIPVVDMNDYYHPEKKEAFLNTLYEAMSTVGFFAVRNTGVDAAIIRDAYEQAERFFKRDFDEKMLSFAEETHGQRGFVPGEIGKGYKEKDKKEFFHVARKTASPANVWPNQEGFQESLELLYDELEKYTAPLLETVVSSINQRSSITLPSDFFYEMTKEGASLIRSIYYPALKTEEFERDQPPFWATPHTDIDFLAILPYATAQGLQVEFQGQWLNVVVPEDAFIVNIGDMLENISNGLFVSARHRVLAQETHQDRFSLVLFVHPYDKAPLDPLPSCIELTGGQQLYAPGNREEFLWERLLELNIGSPALLKLYSETGHVERQAEYKRESPQVVELLMRQGVASPELLQILENRG